MKILINVNHPAHVHLFRNAIRIWQEKGFQTLVVARQKDVTLALLEHYQIPYILGSNSGPGLAHQLVEFYQQTARIVAIGREFKPDVLLSMGSPMAAWASALLRKPHIAFDDTEHARLEHLLYRPFTRRIYTPSCFEENLGAKQVRYNGYHELAYLHPNYFQPDPGVIPELGLSDGQPYFVVRFVSWEANHDIGQRGFTLAERQRLVQTLMTRGRVVISSEGPLPANLESLRYDLPSSRIHHVLAFATMYVGEGGTMATEAALLGTPSIFVSTLESGNWHELRDRYRLLYFYSDPRSAAKKVRELLARDNLKELWHERQQGLLAERIDVTELIVGVIDDYPARTMQP